MSKADQTDAEKAADRWLDDNFDGDDIPYGDMHTAFLAGAEWAAPKWINLKEKQPIDQQRCLYNVVLGGKYHLSKLDYGEWDAADGRFYGEYLDAYEMENCVITHWMPLPEPPKEEK